MEGKNMSDTIGFGQVVIGPPGSGKTTYCKAMQEFLSAIGRKVVTINLDPANDTLPYKCDIDISELITVSDAMDNLKLGPNGGLMYCMEYLEQNSDWLKIKLKDIAGTYVLIDCPGQVELYTHHSAVHNILENLSKWNYRLTAVHLVDSHYCSDPGKFIAVTLTSLATMLQVELPHVNILSKIDLIEQYGHLSFNLEFFTDVLDLQFLLDRLKGDRFLAKYAKLNEALAGLIQDYGLVSFVPLDIQKKDFMLRVLRLIDKANGYMYGDLHEQDVQALLKEKIQIDEDQ